MRMKSYELPKDLVRIGIAFVDGYERRLERLSLLRTAVAQGADVSVLVGNNIGGRSWRGKTHSDPTAKRAMTLDDLSNKRDSKVVAAVESAYEDIGNDCAGEARDRLRQAIYYSCCKGKFTYEYWGLPFSKDNFYKRRRIFIYNVLDKLGYIDELFLVG